MGTHARFHNQNLTFARVENGARAWLVASPRVDEKTPSKITNWKISLSEFQPQMESQNTLSPNGLRLAYGDNRSGMEAIYVEAVGENMEDGNIRRIATMARNPVWQDDETLLYESTRAGRKGLYRITIPADGSTPSTPQHFFMRGGEFALSADGKLICVAVTNQKTLVSQLYLLSADGSGARVLTQTEGARRPCFSPDGKAIFYDAPAPLEEGAQSTPSAMQGRARVIWMLPLIATPPVAQLFAVREGRNGDVEIIGTLFSHEDGALKARLDFSPGDADPEENEGEEGEGTETTERVWFACPLNRAPIQNGLLGSWPLPRKRGGQVQTWTLRLLAVDAAGERSQSILTFNWPLEKDLGENDPVAPPPFVFPTEDFILPEEVKPPAPAIIPAPVPPAPSPVMGTFPKPRPNPAPAALPVPALPPAPKPAAKKPAKNTDFTDEEFSPVPFPIQSTPFPARNEPKPAAKPAAKPTVKPLPPKTISTPTAPKAAANKPAPKPSAKNSGGIPARMKSGSSVPVSVVLKNTGSRSWSSTGESPVRLIYRWVSADSNSRHRWAVHWLRETVGPGKSTKMKFDLIAPPASGRYILTYALVRLNSQNYDGKNYKPPSTKTKDHRWPGEFGAVSFEITVTP